MWIDVCPSGVDEIKMKDINYQWFFGRRIRPIFGAKSIAMVAKWLGRDDARRHRQQTKPLLRRAQGKRPS
jgi:hypothetical protein